MMLVKNKFFDKTSRRYIYMVGEITAVCVSCRVKQITEEVDVGGKIYKRYENVLAPMDGSPYIDFIYVRTDDDGSFCIDEGSPISGGIDTEQASLIRNELESAINLIQNYTDMLMDLNHVEVQS